MVTADELFDGPFHEHAGGVARWAGLLAEPEELEAARALQLRTFTGQPVGNDAFVQQLEKELRRPLTPGQGLRNDLCNACAAAF